MKKLPEIGVELDGIKTLNSAGEMTWKGSPVWIVVGHHSDGKQFFVEHASGNDYIQRFRIDDPSPQYRIFETEREKITKEMIAAISTPDLASIEWNSHAWRIVESLYDAGYRKEGDK